MTTLRRTLAATGLLALALSGITGCAGPLEPEAERPAPDTAYLPPLVTGLNDAGFAMYHAAIRDSDDDVVLSPVSIGLAFGMLDVGATETLADQLAELFSLPASAEQRWHAFNALEQALTAERELRDEEADPIILRVANRLYTDKEFNAEQDFLSTVATYFGAFNEVLSMQEDPDGARKHINAWVKDRTEGLIPQLLPDGSITDESVLVLVNALYFKAAWDRPFEEHLTQDDDFFLLDGTTSTVDMMAAPQFSAEVMLGDGYTAFDLPYANGNLSMTVILPDAGMFSSVESRVGSDLMAQVDDQSANRLINLWMPRFDSGAQTDLASIIEDGLGYDRIFGTRQLEGIGKDVEVTGAFHEARVIVDEEGTEAAAATGIVVGVTSVPPEPDLEIRVDRPFLYLIRDHDTGAVLFVGRVLNPAA